MSKMSVTVAELQALEKEAQVLRATIDNSHMADAKQQLAHLKVRIFLLRFVCCWLLAVQATSSTFNVLFLA